MVAAAPLSQFVEPFAHVRSQRAPLHYMVSFDRLALIILKDTYQFVGARSFIPLCLIIEDLTNKLQLSGAHLWSRERHFLAIEALDHARKKQSNDGAYNTGLERLHNIN